MAGIEQRNGCVWNYGNPAGYIDRDCAVMDVIFQNDELERWFQKNHLSPSGRTASMKGSPAAVFPCLRMKRRRRS